MSLISRSIFPRLLLPLVALALTACSNPVEKEDHPVGLVVLNSQNQQVASFRVGSGVTGQVPVPRATATTFTVAAVGESGGQLTIDGTELGLKVAFAGGEGTATLQGANRVVVTVPSVGTRTLTLTLTHDGHDELRADLPVVVAQ